MTRHLIFNRGGFEIVRAARSIRGDLTDAKTIAPGRRVFQPRRRRHCRAPVSFRWVGEDDVALFAIKLARPRHHEHPLVSGRQHVHDYPWWSPCSSMSPAPHIPLQFHRHLP